MRKIQKSLSFSLSLRDFLFPSQHPGAIVLKERERERERKKKRKTRRLRGIHKTILPYVTLTRLLRRLVYCNGNGVTFFFPSSIVIASIIDTPYGSVKYYHRRYQRDNYTPGGVLTGRTPKTERHTSRSFFLFTHITILITVEENTASLFHRQLAVCTLDSGAHHRRRRCTPRASRRRASARAA